MNRKPSMTTTIHANGIKTTPESRIMLIEAGNITPEFVCIELGVYGAKTEIYIDTDAVTLQAWATELHHLADNLMRKACDKVKIPLDEEDANALPATDPAAYPELSMEVDG